MRETGVRRQANLRRTKIVNHWEIFDRFMIQLGKKGMIIILIIWIFTLKFSLAGYLPSTACV